MIELVAGLTAGPAFLALLGPAGTGKSWMLQAAAAALRRRGQPVILVRRGELPIEVFPGTAVLVDEAARMDDGQLARLAAVRDASVVLADLPAFAARLEQLPRPPTIVPLAPLVREDMPEFVAAWLAARGLPAGVLTHPAISRLFDNSGGVPRLVVQLLRAALAVHGDVGAAGIGADAVDEMAALRLGELDAGTAPPPVPDAPRTVQQEPGAASDAPGTAGQQSAAAGPVPPSEAPVIPPAPPEPVLAAPKAGASPQPRRRVRHAAVPALAASLLIAAALAVRPMQQPPGNLSAAPAASETTPAPAGAAREAGASAGGSMPAAQPPPIHMPDAEASVAVQAQPDAASGGPPSPAYSPAPSPPSSDPSPAPSMEAAATPGQEPAVASGSGQDAAPVPETNPPQTNPPQTNPPETNSPETSLPEPAPPDAPAQALVPPSPDQDRAAPLPSVAGMVPLAAPSASEPAPSSQAPSSPTPSSQEPEPQSPAQAGGAPGLVLMVQAGDTMPDLYAKVYRGVRPPPYADVIAANRLPLRPGAIVVFPTPQDGWLGR
ncbi:MAG TPA: hypothetical protein VGC15_02000 [Acetobacteraceae bacterium]